MEVVPVVPGEGEVSNTRISPSRHWLFTLNNPEELDIALWRNMISDGSMKWVVQHEIGEQGTPHLQGYVDFGRKVRPLSVIKNHRYQWRKIDNIQGTIDYCSKIRTRIAGPWACGIVIPETFLLGVLRDWQKHIMELIAIEPDDRKVNWVVDTRGGKGKTALCKHICGTYKDTSIYVSGKASDIKYAVHEFIKLKRTLHVCLFDFTRSVENFVSYEAIESIKNGIFFNTKYESGMALFKSPHIVCFSNWLPDKSKLSEDRWNIIDIGDGAHNPPVLGPEPGALPGL